MLSPAAAPSDARTVRCTLSKVTCGSTMSTVPALVDGKDSISVFYGRKRGAVWVSLPTMEKPQLVKHDPQLVTTPARQLFVYAPHAAAVRLQCGRSGCWL